MPAPPCPAMPGLALPSRACCALPGLAMPCLAVPRRACCASPATQSRD